MDRLVVGKIRFLFQPGKRDLRQEFPPEVVERIEGYLETDEANPARQRFVNVEAVITNGRSVSVFYLVRHPHGDTFTRMIIFDHHRQIVRVLPVTEDGSVVMQHEYRPPRRKAIWTLPGGGESTADIAKAAVAELEDETGCVLTNRSRILHLGEIRPDDGVDGHVVQLIAIDALLYRESHQNPKEDITHVKIVPWNEWRECALAGGYEDHWTTLFAARCELDESQHSLRVRGKHSDLLRRL